MTPLSVSLDRFLWSWRVRVGRKLTATVCLGLIYLISVKLGVDLSVQQILASGTVACFTWCVHQQGRADMAAATTKPADGPA